MTKTKTKTACESLRELWQQARKCTIEEHDSQLFVGINNSTVSRCIAINTSMQMAAIKCFKENNSQPPTATFGDDPHIDFHY